LISIYVRLEELALDMRKRPNPGKAIVQSVRPGLRERFIAYPPKGIPNRTIKG
jgi:hypothetical protein